MFLSVAILLEGYDFLALPQVLSNLRAEVHVSGSATGVLVALVNFGTIVAYSLAAL